MRMATVDEISRVIGALEAGQEAQEKAHSALSTRVDAGFAELNSKVDRLLAVHEQRRGARRLAAIATAGGGGIIGTVVTIAIAWWQKQP